MTMITLDESRDGLDGFPEDFQPVGRDDNGDVLASDKKGRVWLFSHGEGDWTDRSEAFASCSQLQEFVSFQEEFHLPDGEDLAGLQERVKRIKAFVRSQSRAPYTRDVGDQVLDELQVEIEDRKFRATRKGRSVAARQELGSRCEQLLREHGVPGRWMIRPHAENRSALVAVGRFSPPWTEERIKEILKPLLEETFDLHCHQAPPSW